ncbi:MAG: indole acetimide hydrolase, partial [Methylacidiphilales bacterium]|nr:indole acetimide hydrolase [Candidatus Methylacidiphilales bacterium]
MRAVWALAIPPSTILLVVVASSLALAQDRVNDWLTQPAPGVASGGSGASSGTGAGS